MHPVLFTAAQAAQKQAALSLQRSVEPLSLPQGWACSSTRPFAPAAAEIWKLDVRFTEHGPAGACALVIKLAARPPASATQ